jgi:putative transposase
MNSLSHTRWECSYHIIFIPKYRRKIMFKECRKEIGNILRKLCEFKNVELVEGSISIDHVHMYVKIPPKESVSGFMGYLYRKKCIMARIIF